MGTTTSDLKIPKNTKLLYLLCDKASGCNMNHWKFGTAIPQAKQCIYLVNNYFLKCEF